MKGKQKQNQKGITLIALVITIIVLLILAGVSINLVFNDGIAEKAQTAVDKYSEESAKEKLSLSMLNYKMGMITGEAGETEGKKTFKDHIEEIGGTIKATTDTKYTIILDGYEFEVKKDNYEITSKEETTGGSTGETTGGTTGGITETPEITKYTVALVKENGIEEVTGGGKVEKGKSLSISATVASGYTFKKWEITSGTGTIENATSASTKVTPTSNITIKAIAESNGDNTNGTENKKMISDADYSYTNPVIPVGFKTSDEGASWDVRDGKVIGWNDGLVIQDGSGNQFVWVPVDGVDVSYGYHYSVGSTGSTSLEQSLPTGIESEDVQITKYGGFYIARYEAGIPESMTSAISTASTTARNVSGTPVSKKSQVPWNYISWSQSKTNAESMYTLAKTNNKVQSTLITDRMWETTMQWLENSGLNVKSDSREWGNYYNAPVTGITEYSTNYGASWTTVASTTKGTSTSWLLKTGHTEYTSRKNISDLAGNLSEWTNAKYSSSSSYYVGRGGYYSGNGTGDSASFRVYYSGTAYSGGVGFRAGLFVQ